jgi:hypothetical protein
MVLTDPQGERREDTMHYRRLTARRQWVSKTDLSRWYRCPYAFWLRDSGQITFEETVSQFQMSLIRAGSEYQELVEQSATPVVIAPDDLPALLRTDITILGTPLFEHKRMKLRGCPDGIDAASGALYPIEIKSHPPASTGWSWRSTGCSSNRTAHGRLTPRAYLSCAAAGSRSAWTCRSPPRCSLP